MRWLTNEFLFYGGIAVAIVSIILLVVYCITLKRNGKKLNNQLDKEYGTDVELQPQEGARSWHK
jgi:uncharacterized protein YoxC